MLRLSLMRPCLNTTISTVDLATSLNFPASSVESKALASHLREAFDASISTGGGATASNAVNLFKLGQQPISALRTSSAYDMRCQLRIGHNCYRSSSEKLPLTYTEDV